MTQRQMTVRVDRGDKTWAFENDPGLSLLDQLLAHSIPISHSCRRGDCGQCAIELITGDSAALDDTRPVLQNGKLLSCNASARSALHLSIPHDGELDGIVVRRSPAKIHALERLSDEVLALTLRLPPSTELRFLPGQFIRLTNREGITRSYSLAAGPAEDRLLRLHIRKVAGGAFSQWLFERASVNDLLHLEGPHGRFFLRQGYAASRSIFLATGTGIAPIWAMLAATTPQQRQQLGEVSVYWGNRLQHEAYLAESLRQLAVRMDFRLALIFSREPAATAHRHVQQRMLDDHPQLDNAQLFACGNPAMIASARELALGAGLPAERFYSDSFTAS